MARHHCAGWVGNGQSSNQSKDLSTYGSRCCWGGRMKTDTREKYIIDQWRRRRAILDYMVITAGNPIARIIIIISSSSSNTVTACMTHELLLLLVVVLLLSAALIVKLIDRSLALCKHRCSVVVRHFSVTAASRSSTSPGRSAIKGTLHETSSSR